MPWRIPCGDTVGGVPLGDPLGGIPSGTPQTGMVQDLIRMTCVVARLDTRCFIFVMFCDELSGGLAYHQYHTPQKETTIKERQNRPPLRPPPKCCIGLFCFQPCPTTPAPPHHASHPQPQKPHQPYQTPTKPLPDPYQTLAGATTQLAPTSS